MWTITHRRHNNNKAFFWLLLAAIILVGCGTSSQPEATTIPEANLPTQVATAAATALVTATPAATLEPTAAATPTTNSPLPSVPDSELYLDDRSDPIAVLTSLVNALNRHEYLRAYGYWEENAIDLPAYEPFAEGYAETSSIQLQTGPVYGGVAAGNTYFDVPTILIAETTAGETQSLVGCYRLHLGSPAAQGALPFRPLGIQSAQINQVATQAEAESLLGQQCLNENGQPNGQPLPAPTAAADDDISGSRYLDDRSNSVQVIRSYFNAVNRHEYVRAYDYWQNQAALPALDDFVAGYENTMSVQLVVGAETLDAGAGQLYSVVPVVLIAQTAAGQTETFAGCYTLHLSNPTIQATPPFQPWGIQSAEIHQVANESDSQQLLTQSCPGN